jgi:hypothetical protein
MMKKLTVTISEDVYNGLHAKIGTGKISRFIDRITRPYVVDSDIVEGYKAMAADQQREKDADEWLEGLLNETR